MIPTAAWFEREFTFDLPVWMFPNVVERLRGTPARLEDRFRPLPANLLTQRDGDDWSLQEHAGHLYDFEALAFGRLEDFRDGLPDLRPADLTNRKTYEANHNADTIDHIFALFRAERARLVSQLEVLDEAYVERSALHPRLNKPMRVIDLAYFHAEHDDHHLVQISELIRKLS
jgi:hypothetical protein